MNTKEFIRALEHITEEKNISKDDFNKIFIFPPFYYFPISSISL